MVTKQVNPQYGTTRLDLGYEPHAGQAWLHQQPERIKVLRVARRWGKSRWALWELIRHFIESLEVPAAPSLVPPWHAWIVCPSFPQARQTWNELIAFLPHHFYSKGDIHHDDRMIYLRGTEQRPWGLIEVKSAHEPDSLQTAGLDFLWIQEAQDVSQRAFEKLLPMTNSPNRTGYCVWEGIPALYPTHWFQRAYELGQRGTAGYLSYSATYLDNPFLSEEQLAEILAHRELLPLAAWNRMYLAEYSEDAGYFTNIAACTWGDELPGPLPGVTYVAGLDLGRKVDASVLHIMDASSRRVHHHMRWDQGTDYVLQREGIARTCKEWGVTRLVVDASAMGGDVFASELIEVGLPVEPFQISRTTRIPLLQNLAVSLERQTVSFPPIPETLRELRAFQHVQQSNGEFRLEAPNGEHDDEVFGLALALTACIDPPAVVEARRVFYQSRYVPTQQEAEGQGLRTGYGARYMHQRKIDRIKARQDEAGIV
jgi:hypothetical protein